MTSSVAFVVAIFFSCLDEYSTKLYLLEAKYKRKGDTLNTLRDIPSSKTFLVETEDKSEADIDPTIRDVSSSRSLHTEQDDGTTRCITKSEDWCIFPFIDGEIVGETMLIQPLLDNKAF